MLRKWIVGQHQENAAGHQEAYQHQGHSPKAEGVGESQRAPPNPDRPHVQDEKLQDRASPVGVGFGDHGPREDRSEDSLDHVRL